MRLRSTRSSSSFKTEAEKVVSGGGQRVVPGTGVASAATQEAMSTRARAAGAAEVDGKRKRAKSTAAYPAKRSRSVGGRSRSSSFKPTLRKAVAGMSLAFIWERGREAGRGREENTTGSEKREKGPRLSFIH